MKLFQLLLIIHLKELNNQSLKIEYFFMPVALINIITIYNHNNQQKITNVLISIKVKIYIMREIFSRRIA